MTRGAPSGVRARRWDLLPLVAVLILAVPLLIWATRRGSDDAGEPAPVVAPASISHVHALGIDPAAGDLLVATHTGTYRLPQGSRVPELLGSSFQDTMGFTVVGEDHFLGSGHPDVAGMQAGKPGQLGLIESKDGGETWSDVSLSGDADFHALASVHDRVYGWDASTGRFMVSADGTSWDERSSLDLLAFVVDPADPEHVVAATGTGLLESSDGGAEWKPTDGPGLAVLSWPDGTRLWGVDADGGVWSRDGTSPWEQAGTVPGQPQALFADDDTLHVAIHDAEGVTSLHRSDDGGRTWSSLYRDDR